MPAVAFNLHTRNLCGKESRVAENVIELCTNEGTVRFPTPRKLTITNRGDQVWVFEIGSDEQGRNIVYCTGHGELDIRTD